MIVDMILDRKDGVPYDAMEFYLSMLSYGGYYGDRISRAMDYGTEIQVKHALCEYIDGADYNPNIKDYINSVNWI